MNKKILLFSLLSISAFASTTGNFELGMETMPKMNAEKKWEVKYTVPFKASLNVENTGFSAGIEGKYNKESLIDKIDLFGFKDTKLFANYTFNKNQDNQVTLGVENEIEVSSNINNKKLDIILNKFDTNFKLDYTKNLSETDKFNLKTNVSTYLNVNNKETKYGFKGLDFSFGMHNVVNNVTLDSELKFKHLRKFDLPLVYKTGDVLFPNVKVENDGMSVLHFGVEGSQQQQISLNKLNLTFKEGFVYDEYRGTGISSGLIETDSTSLTKLDEADKDYRVVSKNKFYLNAKLDADIYSAKLEIKSDNSLEYVMNNNSSVKLATKDASYDSKTKKLNTYNAGNVKLTFDPSIKLSKDFNIEDKLTIGLAGQVSSKQELYVSQLGTDKDSFLKNDVKVSLTGSLKAQLVEGLTANLTFTPEAVFESNEYVMNKKEGKDKYKLSFKEFTPKVYFGINYNW